MVYCFDIDNTICHTENGAYESSAPFHDIIFRINRLYDQGHTIKLYTARGMTRFRGNAQDVHNAYQELTVSQLKQWGVKYHELLLAKPSYDVFVDDKNMTITEFKNKFPIQIGFVAGAFDVIHPGYIALFKEAREVCDFLTVGLHVDPSVERYEKLRPIFSVEERRETLLALRYVDKVVTYTSEEELLQILEKEPMNIRFLGDDYIGKEHLGFHLNTPIHYIRRDHGWSYRKLISCLKSL